MAGVRKRKGSMLGPRGLKGDKGDRGLQGLPGTDGLPTGEAIAQHLQAAGPARTSLRDAVAQVGGPGTLSGNRIAVLGDSTARGTYDGDSEPGIDGAVLLIPGMSWLTWAQHYSGGRIIRSKNAAIIGNTLAQMDARVQVDVIAHKPDACIVVSGYNDAFQNVTLASYQESMKSIHGKLLAAGIEMIVCTPLPTANGGAGFSAILDSYSTFVREFAGTYGLQLLDFNADMKHTDGGLIPSVKTDGDGVHPGAAGQMVLGKYVADRLSPRLPRAASTPLRRALGPFGNIAPNRLFSGTVTNGMAASVFRVGAADGAVTPSVVTAPFVEGNMQRITHAGSTALSRYAQRVQKAGQWDTGDLLAFTGVVTTSGIPAEVEVEFNTAPYGHKAARVTKDAVRAAYYAELRVPAGMAGTYFDVNMRSGPGTGFVEFGEFSVYNLTKLGMA